jgi:HEAT repeat protein
VVETLNKYWKRRVFGTRPLPFRLAAIQALGAITAPEASRALAEAAQSGEVQVQRAAARAQSEAQARTRGQR